MGQQFLATVIIVMADLVTNSKTERDLSGKGDREPFCCPRVISHRQLTSSPCRNHVYLFQVLSQTCVLVQGIWKPEERKGQIM